MERLRGEDISNRGVGDISNRRVEDIPNGLFERCIEKRLNAFCIRESGSDKLIFGCSDELLEGLHEDCFIFAPFVDATQIKSIPCKFSINEIESISNAKTMNDRELAEIDDETSTTKEEHEENVRKIVDILKKDGGGKVVLSRVLIKEGTLNITTFFKELCKDNPEATVFWFYTPATSSYIGATPELLLERRGKELRSMALAGTRIHDPLQTRDWDSKNIEEQEIVAEYISGTFLNHNFKPIREKRFNLKAGKIEHLCTIIRSEIKSENKPEERNSEKKPEEMNSESNSGEILSLLSSLSPTPALCGMPRETAFNIIHDLERHKRRYYGGFMGFVHNIKDFKLYVILRCLRYGGEKITLYAGGGITRFSNPKDEWQETENKLTTLLKTGILEESDKKESNNI